MMVCLEVFRPDELKYAFMEKQLIKENGRLNNDLFKFEMKNFKNLLNIKHLKRL